MNKHPLRQILKREKLTIEIFTWSSKFYQAWLECGHRMTLSGPGAYKQERARCYDCVTSVISL